MSEEADRRIAKVVAAKKAANDAEKVRLQKVKEQQQSDSDRYTAAAEKFRGDIPLIQELVTEKNKLLEDADIALKYDGGRALQGLNQLEMTVIATKTGKGNCPRLVFRVAESGFGHQIQMHSRSVTAPRPKADVMKVDAKYYEEAITSFIEAVLAE